MQKYTIENRRTTEKNSDFSRTKMNELNEGCVILDMLMKNEEIQEGSKITRTGQFQLMSRNMSAQKSESSISAQ